MLTILIPTYRSKSNLLFRLLNYISEGNFEATILIADSNSPEGIEANVRLIRKLKPTLSIIHNVFDRELDLYEKISLAAIAITTPYTVICADDDFLVPASLKKAVEFLEANVHYSAAHGYAAGFELRDNLVHGKIEAVNCETQRSIQQISPTDRLIDHLRYYSLTFYSVQRTEQIRENFRKLADLKLNMINFRFRELLTSCLSVIQGKTRKLDCLYMVRQSHQMSDAHNQKNYALWEWMADKNWSDEYSKFRVCLAEELAWHDGINMEQAKHVVKYAFWLYVALDRFNRQEQNNELTLPALLRRSSPFHEAFMPIYRAITIPPSTEIETTRMPNSSTAMLYW